MSEQTARYTLSAVAWVLTVLCSIALLTTAVAAAKSVAAPVEQKETMPGGTTQIP